ncbi:MAG: NADH-quinone oxidoreductase subunit M [Chloroflexota bacterium]|nr:MAG: NADH-quinone oxidoreductase subunit M [Chloroflexota bacterium]
MSVPILTLLILFPLLAALITALLPRDNMRLIKGWAFVAVAIEFGLSLYMLANFVPNTSQMQFVEFYPWVPQFGISYHVGVDGLSFWLVILTTFLMLIAIPASFSEINVRVKEYFIFFLILESALLGVFVALDLFLFYVFWEFSLIPMALIIGIWGHEQRIYAAVKFILFTMAGSLLMLVAILVLYFATGARSFDLLELQKTIVPANLQPWLFAAFALAFAIKVPMFPVHTWLPDAHVQAPAAGSIILAGVLLKLGAYGFMRYNLTLFPDASQQFAPILVVLAIIGIIYGAMTAAVQKDLKALIAYSSVTHMGFIILGIFVFSQQALSGAILQMVNHGISTGALFLMVGLLYERRHTHLITEFGGLQKVIPVFGFFFLFVMFSSMGLPGLNGFVGEFLVLLGSWETNPAYAAVAAVGVILAAIYLLWAYQRVMQGPVTNEKNKTLPDLNRRELALLVVMAALIVLIGIFPDYLLNPMQASVTQLLHFDAVAGLVK